jgi:putative FmdB family regulatory protein
MPIYEYRCSSCGFQKEYLQKVSDPLMTVCPECNKQTLSKMLTAAGFQLKGSGWYATDFRNSGAKPAAKTGDKDAAKTESKETAKADGKESVKADAKEAPKVESKTESKPDAPSTGASASPASS